MRICSLVPSATEIVFALRLGEEVVSVSHECDYPPEAARKPRVIRTTMDAERLTSEQIDAAVHAALARRESLYEIDEPLLRRLRPELVVTQALCEVCAIEASQVSAALRTLVPRPEILALHPHTLEEALADIGRVGEATGRRAEADRLLAACRARLDRVRARVAGAERPRVLCLEWLKPPMCGGHWVPDMVACAGGTDVLGRSGEPSRYITWEEVAAARPEVVVVMPCGFSVARAQRELPLVTAEPAWSALPAVRARRVHVVDGPAYFNGSGPRLVDGVELFARLLHPEFWGGRTHHVPPLVREQGSGADAPLARVGRDVHSAEAVQRMP